MLPDIRRARSTSVKSLRSSSNFMRSKASEKKFSQRLPPRLTQLCPKAEQRIFSHIIKDEEHNFIELVKKLH